MPGLTAFAQRTAVHASARIFLSTGLPPFAVEWSLQSGENHAAATRRLPTSSRGL